MNKSFSIFNNNRRRLQIVTGGAGILLILFLYTFHSTTEYQVVAASFTADGKTVNLNKEPSYVRDLDNTIVNQMEPENMDIDPQQTQQREPQLSERLVHLDLKGAPPKLSYYEELFPLLKTLGATGLLLEYEDMFPYSGRLSHVAAKNAYSREDISTINKLAKNAGLEVIPLVQTFGHLEFILKLESEVELREVPLYAEVICPSHNKSVPLLFEILKQVRDLHPDVRRIHIGSDEVYYIGKCSRCQNRLVHNRWSNSDLFLDHVTRVASYVKDTLKAQPLMWDDEFRTMSETDLKKWDVGNLVEIVIWQYSTSVSTVITNSIMSKYLAIFQGLWIASAFKGATGPDQFLTDIEHHLENHRSWLYLLESYRSNPNFTKIKGIMITGWQRYDHFSVLCELLPVGLPSLAVNLLLVSGLTDRNQVVSEAKRLLKCQYPLQSLSLVGQTAGFTSVNECDFPGSEIFQAVQRFGQMKQQYELLQQNSVIRGWMSEYNLRNKFSSPGHVDRIGNQLFHLKNSIEGILDDCKKAMILVFDEHTVKEWTDTFIIPVQSWVEKTLLARDVLLAQSSWPRRPLDS